MARQPAQVIANAAELRLYWSNNGQLAINVIGCSHLGPVTFNQALADALGTGIKNAFTANLAGVATAQLSLARVGIRSLSSPALPEFRDVGAAIAGTGTGDPLPGSVAVCVTLRTARSGKSYRGRMYVPGMGESQNGATGTASTGTHNAVLTFAVDLNAVLAANGLTTSVLSRPHYEEFIEKTTLVPGQDPQVERLSHTIAKAGSFQNVTAFECRTLGWESQRRRTNGRGQAPSALFGGQRVDISLPEGQT